MPLSIQTDYVAGTCNIGPEERKMRYRVGWLGLSVAVVLWVLFLIFKVQNFWRLTLFFPAAGAAFGFLQAWFHFCARFGFSGVFNLKNAVGNVETVTDPDSLDKDRRKAQLIVFLALLFGAAVAFAGFIL